MLFRRYKHKLTSNINVENAVKQASRTNASEREDDNFFQIVSSNSNPKKEFLLKHKFYNLEVRFVSYEPFSEFICTLYFEYYFYFTLPFKILLCSNWTNNIYIFFLLNEWFLIKIYIYIYIYIYILIIKKWINK